MAQTRRNTFVEANRFSAVVMQTGRVAQESEWNEQVDITRVNLIARSFFAAVGDGFREFGGITGGANQISILKPVDALADGLGYHVPGTGTLVTITGLTTPAGSDRDDTVWLRITEDEVPDPLPDPTLGETSRRRQVTLTFGVAEGAGLPATTGDPWAGGEYYIEVAVLHRLDGNANVTGGMVEYTFMRLPGPALEVLIAHLRGGFAARRPYAFATATPGNLYVGNVAGVLTETPQTRGITGEQAVALSGLTIGNWYAVYFDTSLPASPFCVIEDYVANPPDALRRYKAGDPNKVYVCSAYATAADAVRPFFMENGRYAWRGQFPTANQLVNGGTSGSAQAVDATTLVPPHARTITLTARVLNFGTSAALFLYLYARNDTSAVSHLVSAAAAHTGEYAAGQDTFDLECNGGSATSFGYEFATTTPGSSINIWAKGWVEPM